MEKNGRYNKLQEIYLKTIKNHYQKYKKDIHKKVLKNFIITNIITIILSSVVSVIIFGFIAKKDLSYIIGATVLFVIIFFSSSCIQADKGYKYILKQHYLKHLLSIFPEINYFKYPDDFSKVINRDELKKSKLFFNYNYIIYNDIITGKYKNIEFEINETDIEKLIDFPSGRKRYPIKTFRGIIFLFYNYKKVGYTTVVSKKNILLNFRKLLQAYFPILILILILILLVTLVAMGIITSSSMQGLLLSLALLLSPIFLIIFTYNKIRNIINDIKTDNLLNNDLNKVIISDSKINENFNIFSQDKIEAEKIVTPSFIDILNNLKKIFRAKDIKCSFFENKLMITIETRKDAFEFGNLFNSVENPNNLTQLYKEINSIFDVIDALDT